MAGSFELFGLDFIVDEDGKVWLLEVNSDPSLAVFGERLAVVFGFDCRRGSRREWRHAQS